MARDLPAQSKIGLALLGLGGLELVLWASGARIPLTGTEIALEDPAFMIGIGIFFLSARWKSPLLPRAACLAMLAWALTLSVVHLGHDHQTVETPLCPASAIGYALIAIALCLLLKRGQPGNVMIAHLLLALPLFGSFFFLVIYVIDVSLLAPATELGHISVLAALGQIAASMAIIGTTGNFWRQDGLLRARVMLIMTPVVCASMAVTIWAALMWSGYTATQRQTEQQLAQAARFIDGYTERSMESANLLALKALTAIVIGPDGTPSLPQREGDEIASIIEPLPQIETLFVIDAKGTIVFSARETASIGLNISDRAYFKAIRDDNQSYFLGNRIFLRTNNKPGYTMSYRIERDEAEFAGVVVVVIATEYFSHFLSRFGDGNDSFAAVAKRDGDVLTSNTLTPILRDWAGVTALIGPDRRWHDNEIVIKGRLDDNKPRFIALHTNERTQTAILTSATERSVLGKWRQSVFATGGVLAAVLIGGMVFALIGHRSIKREEMLQQQAVALASFQNAVLHSASSAIVAFGTNGVITLFNRAAETLFGYRSTETVGKRSPEFLFDPAELGWRAERLQDENGRPLAPDYRAITAYAANAAVDELEWTCVRMDGSKIPVTIAISTLKDDTGAVDGYLAIINGISARKKAERELRFGEARLRAILDNVIDGIITINSHGIIQSVNPAAERIFGYTTAELIDQNVKILMGEPYHSHHDAYLGNYLRTGEAQIIGRGREVEGKRKDGSTFPLDLAVSQVELSGRPIFVGVIRDLTDQKRVEQLKSEFVSTVSHELRTPLTAIRGALSLVNSDVLGEVPDDVKELTVVAEQSSERLIRLINDILDVEKIGSGQMRLEMQPVIVSQIINRAVTDTKAFAEQFKVRLAIVENLEEARILGDSDRLVQVMTNLISNAAKFSHPDRAVEISSRLYKPGYVRISVVDHGIGIAKEFHSRIFQKFAQADGSDSKAKGGTGLGLNITRSLVEKMGGTISFESEVGAGTTFHVDFPLLFKSDQTARATPTGKPRILHVEDDLAIAKMIARLLANQAEVLNVESVEEGLALAARQDFDLAIIDLGLADGNGLDVVPMLQNPAGQPPPVIVFSAHDQKLPNLPESVVHVLVKAKASDRELVEAVRSVISSQAPV